MNKIKVQKARGTVKIPPCTVEIPFNMDKKKQRIKIKKELKNIDEYE